MFKRFYNEGDWLRIAKKTETEKMKKAILELFIPYRIDVTKYGINEVCFLQEDSYDDETKQYCTASMTYWIERFSIDDVPMGFPGWFYPAFPDVARWTQTFEARYLLEPIFELNKGHLEDSSDGRLRLPVLKSLIEAYIGCTGKKLEVSI